MTTSSARNTVALKVKSSMELRNHKFFIPLYSIFDLPERASEYAPIGCFWTPVEVLRICNNPAHAWKRPHGRCPTQDRPGTDAAISIRQLPLN